MSLPDNVVETMRIRYEPRTDALATGDNLWRVKKLSKEDEVQLLEKVSRAIDDAWMHGFKVIIEHRL